MNQVIVIVSLYDLSSFVMEGLVDVHHGEVVILA